MLNRLPKQTAPATVRIGNMSLPVIGTVNAADGKVTLNPLGYALLLRKYPKERRAGKRGAA